MRQMPTKSTLFNLEQTNVVNLVIDHIFPELARMSQIRFLSESDMIFCVLRCRSITRFHRWKPDLLNALQ